MVEAPGFKKLEQKGIVIVTQTANTQDVKLDIGQVTETIDVTAEAELLERLGSLDRNGYRSTRNLEDIPNLGRDPFMLARLSEGVVWTGNPKFDRMEDQSGQSSVSIAGGPTQTNNYTLDGVSITDSTNRAVIIPSMEGCRRNEGSGEYLRRLDGPHRWRRFQCYYAFRPEPDARIAVRNHS